ncbi:MAG: VCBS repeat-containing protein [Nitrospirota bacterium]
MRLFIAVFFSMVLFSCAPEKEIITSPRPPYPPVKPPPEIVTPPKYKTYLKCYEETKNNFNRCGIEILPFIRTVFFDIDNDGIQEMIAGSKDGLLRLYRRSGSDDKPVWSLVENYFDGIRAGAFSSPAAGDIDNDGRPEILVGTGGFSSNSGIVVFYKNSGSLSKPFWKKIVLTEPEVGDDATPALSDIDHDGMPDLIVGNSNGNLFLFRNKSGGGKIIFKKDISFFKGLDLGMYVVPAVTVDSDKIVLIAGNSMGKLYLLEKTNGSNSLWKKSTLGISLSSFAAPTFINNGNKGLKDLVISDGNGQLYYYKNMNGNYTGWRESSDFFSDRLFTGPACTPALSDLNGISFMVVGNINGEIRIFEHNRSSGRLPWIERPDFFRNIKLSSFSRGIITEWKGKYLLITGQQDGILRAFLNSGSFDKPSWIEQKQFFRGIPKIPHAAPAVFDINGDGKWELIVGDVDGFVKGFRYDLSGDGKPIWKEINNSFDHVKVDRYATPALFSDSDNIYLLVGQQDGKINTFISHINKSGIPVFFKEGYIQGIKVNNHSSPSAFVKNGLIEISVGDYNGNLKHFACQKDTVEVREN